jgi:hypothetical protein
MSLLLIALFSLRGCARVFTPVTLGADRRHDHRKNERFPSASREKRSAKTLYCRDFQLPRPSRYGMIPSRPLDKTTSVQMIPFPLPLDIFLGN